MAKQENLFQKGEEMFHKYSLTVFAFLFFTGPFLGACNRTGLSPDERPDVSKFIVFHTINLIAESPDGISIVKFGTATFWAQTETESAALAKTITLLGSDEKIVIYQWLVRKRQYQKEGTSYFAFDDGKIFTLDGRHKIDGEIISMEPGKNKIRFTMYEGDMPVASKEFAIKRDFEVVKKKNGQRPL